jgi:hypothetical protein
LTTAALPIAVNRTGLSLVEWIGPAAGVGRVVVRPGERDALIRLDHFEIVATTPEGTDTTVYSWKYGDDPGGLPAAGVWWVAPGVLAVDAHSTVTVDIQHPSPVGELRVALAGAYLVAPQGSTLASASTDAELEAARRELDAVYGTMLFRVAAKPRRLYGALRRRRRR